MKLKQRIGTGLASPDSKRRYVRDLFGKVADRYDLTNDVMSLGLHRRWKARLIELAEIRAGDVVLDLAAGTGDLALGSVGPASPDGLVIGADLTLEMIQVGRRREADRGLGESRRIDWVCGDAMRLPFRDASVDRVLIGYGLRNFPELEPSLSEIYRCLRPGGPLLALEFGKPTAAWLRTAYLAYLDASTRVVGWALHRDPESYAYIPESLRRFPGQRGVMEQMRAVGFVGCGFVDLVFGTMAINFGRRADGAAVRPRVLPRETSTR